MAAVIDAAACDRLTALIEELGVGAGSRRLLEVAEVAHLALSLRRNVRIASLLAPDSVAVQCTYFNKSAETNWGVALHQDTVMPVHSSTGNVQFRNRSSKEGIPHAQPPLDVLESMLAVRVHLDPNDATNGPLRVVPASHTNGVLSEAQCRLEAKKADDPQCLVARGGALVLRPLLLHASGKLTGTTPRRVLHFVYAPRRLAGDAHWHYQV